MKIAVLGDIHGNSLALKAVLNEIRNEGIDRLLIAGDLVGYYYHPDEVFVVLSDFDYEMVQGNHDEMLAAHSVWDDRQRAKYNSKYGSALKKAAEQLSNEQINVLQALPWRRELVIEGKKIILCHGSPLDRDEYIYPDAPENVFDRSVAQGEYDLVIMGHTHYPLLKKNKGVTFLNPGSVGQPRDGRPGASWAILNTTGLAVEFRLTQYDVGAVAAEARRNDPELPYLSQVLMKGQDENR
ncbi:MAG: metallophosphoesterase family protein [Candidatus Margulisiibacteriota bacterium]